MSGIKYPSGPEANSPTSPSSVTLPAAQSDAFGRIRVSTVQQLVSAPAVHGIRADIFDTSTSGGGTATASLDGSVALTVGTASGDRVSRRGHVLQTYRAGQGLRSFLTFCLPAAQANQVVEVGLYDGPQTSIGGSNRWANGVILRRSGTGEVTLLVRNASATQDSVAQSAWDDPMDGIGSSGVTLDWTKSQILAIDLQALYVGRVRVGFEVGGVLHIAHEFKHSNVIAGTYLASANLAPWYHIENTGTTGAGATLQQICAEMSREGGADELGRVVQAFNAITSSPTVDTTLRSILAVRLWQGFPSALLRPVAAEIFNRSSVAMDWALLLNPTLGGALTWAGSVAAGTRMVEVSTTQQNVTARGTTLLAGFAGSGAGGTNARGNVSASVVSDRTSVGFDLGGTSDVLVLAATGATGTGNAVHGRIAVAELE